MSGTPKTGTPRVMKVGAVPDDERGRFLSAKLTQFDLGVKALRDAFKHMHDTDKQMRARMGVVYEKLGGENNMFREEKYIPLREITKDMGEASHHVMEHMNDVGFAADVVECCDQLEGSMLGPMRELLNDRAKCYKKFHETRIKLDKNEELLGEMTGFRQNQRKYEKTVDLVHDLREQLAAATDMLSNVEEVVAYNFEMYEFHRVRQLRQIYLRICRAQLMHGAELMSTYTPLHLHLRNGDMEPMRAREDIRARLAAGDFE
mmetsp:Transcript_21920/g.67319  ORF Transcript_21920/g.67319 Transcript_21920/m.67319 type:complete len:261 (-) Transcript_21920:156-938(-)|eukprot:CAMPEP_0118867848 /NCGR_PEP_ID=MMETSP1163-20130328/11293_1 /TAXON_ID=124430 /ORGANISM="Phaeomonas parva, Strain CCMP2877" /LENGTH=260 /DNA_ID=CAMNT_0006802321 /DNA_START=234 /DNA_END=1016 /DNA_ORIENTATION=+